MSHLKKYDEVKIKVNQVYDNISTPTNPPAGEIKTYSKNDRLAFLDSAGREYILSDDALSGFNVYLSSTGNDSTAVFENPSQPYLTLDALLTDLEAHADKGLGWNILIIGAISNFYSNNTHTLYGFNIIDKTTGSNVWIRSSLIVSEENRIIIPVGTLYFDSTVSSSITYGFLRWQSDIVIEHHIANVQFLDNGGTTGVYGIHGASIYMSFTNMGFYWRNTNLGSSNFFATKWIYQSNIADINFGNITTGLNFVLGQTTGSPLSTLIFESINYTGTGLFNVLLTASIPHVIGGVSSSSGDVVILGNNDAGAGSVKIIFKDNAELENTYFEGQPFNKSGSTQISGTRIRVNYTHTTIRSFIKLNANTKGPGEWYGFLYLKDLDLEITADSPAYLTQPIVQGTQTGYPGSIRSPFQIRCNNVRLTYPISTPIFDLTIQNYGKNYDLTAGIEQYVIFENNNYFDNQGGLLFDLNSGVYESTVSSSTLVDLTDKELAFNRGSSVVHTGTLCDLSDFSIKYSGEAIKMSNYNKGEAPSATTGENQPTGITLKQKPVRDSYVYLFVDNTTTILYVKVGEAKTGNNCYFSRDAGTTALDFKNLQVGDQLIWNGTTAGYDLTALFKIDIMYLT